jgi:hypothetical protein
LGDLDKVTGAEIDRISAVNVKAQFFVAQQAGKHVQSGGWLVLMSSISSVMVYSPYSPHHSSSLQPETCRNEAALIAAFNGPWWLIGASTATPLFLPTERSFIAINSIVNNQALFTTFLKDLLTLLERPSSFFQRLSQRSLSYRF